MDSQTFQEQWDCYWRWEPKRHNIYRMVAQEFSCQSALYPGSGTDVIPSVWIPHVIYIDKSPLVTEFFQFGDLRSKLDHEKRYDGPCIFEYYEADYNVDYNALSGLPQVDLLISQYAGMVGRDMKQYLKPGGILLVAEGPPDAAAAMCDPDYELLGTIRTGSEQDKIVSEYLPRAWVEVEGNRVFMDRNFCFRKRYGR